ncbi:response regulator [Leucothrix pacifica]|nr:response regulator [Leucothrix pacifica]
MAVSPESTSVLLKQPDTKLNILKQQIALQKSEIEQLEAKLALAEREIDKRSQDKMALLGNMNHEIRTPMNGIIGMAALLAESSLTPKQQQHTKIILESSRSLFQVLSDTMDLAELENGRVSVVTNHFKFLDFVNKVLNQMAPQAAAKGVELVCAMSKDIPEALKTDEQKLSKLLCALISDAIKLTKKQHIFIQADLTNARNDWGTLHFEISHCGFGSSQKYLDNIVSGAAIKNQENDYGQHGIGTSLAISRHLVTLLSGDIGGKRDDHSNTHCWVDIPVNSLKGTIPRQSNAGHCAYFQLGDNLYLEHQILSLNGSVERIDSLESLFSTYQRRKDDFNKFIVDTDGMSDEQLNPLIEYLKESVSDDKSWVIIRAENDARLDQLTDSKLNGWSEISKPWSQFKLKLAVTGRSADADDTEHNETLSSEANKIHILLVEDNRVNQMVAKALLSKLGYQVTIANDGVEAIEKYLKHDFELVLMDIRMPRMDGVEATQELKKMMNNTGHPVPVIALTANATIGAKEKYLELGLDDYLPKPVQAPQLSRILNKWLGAEINS